ncbi:MAG: hypothetical protein LUG49_01855 [Oscillospiraceae bacterium]|nr:hypothetical protein [Oscillospiraceae bacterium]
MEQKATQNNAKSIIEAYVGKKLEAMRDNPDRESRNLVDLALGLSAGRFQKHFLSIAHSMLEDENSPYYALIHDAIKNVGTANILKFGMNIGYNSFTAGAKTIRNLEKERGYNIPWIITFYVDSESFSKDAYSKVIKQGVRLGIYTYVFFCSEIPEKLTEIFDEESECAFILFSDAENIEIGLLEQASEIKNLMLCVRYSDSAIEACERLRISKALYSIWYEYSSESSLMYDELLNTADELHPVLTFFVNAEKNYSGYNDVYNDIYKLRDSRTTASAPMEFTGTCIMVDEIISDDSCLAVFNESGKLISVDDSENECNFRNQTLAEIFEKCYPKVAK